MSSNKWRNVNKRERCSKCQGEDWCSQSTDGKTIICRRINDGTAIVKSSTSGGEYYIYSTSITSIKKLQRTNLPTYTNSKNHSLKADIVTLDRIYSCFLSNLDLEVKHLDALESRGLSREEIKLRNYKSIPKMGRAKIVRQLLEKFPADQILRTPGFYLKKEYISFSGKNGLAIPCRDIEGRIFAIKIRIDDEQEGGKYRYFSSTFNNGPSAISSTHCPLRVNHETSTVIVTEGELKADICCFKNLPYTIAVPGVSNLKGLLESLKKINPTKVNIAFDNDMYTNQNVKKAFLNIRQLLLSNGYKVGALTWN